MTTKGKDEKLEIQSKIGRYISIGKENIHFQVQKKKSKVVLRLITFNPIHNQSFLFHSVSSDSDTATSSSGQGSSPSIEWVSTISFTLSFVN